MGSTPKRLALKNIPTRKSSHHKTRSSSSSSARQHHKPLTATTTSSSSSVSDKLEALKSLVPAQEIDTTTSTTAADQLFKETADYILLLRTQVSILQKLVDFYASSPSSSPVQQ